MPVVPQKASNMHQTARFYSSAWQVDVFDRVSQGASHRQFTQLGFSSLVVSLAGGKEMLLEIVEFPGWKSLNLFASAQCSRLYGLSSKVRRAGEAREAGAWSLSCQVRRKFHARLQSFSSAKNKPPLCSCSCGNCGNCSCAFRGYFQWQSGAGQS